MPVPYLRIAKFVGVGLVVLALATLIWSWHARGQRIDSLEGWQSSVVEATTQAVVVPDRNGRRPLIEASRVPAAIAGLAASLASADRSLTEIAGRTTQAQGRDRAADAALARENADLRRRYSSAEERIAELQARPAPQPGVDRCQTLEEDTRAPWELWR